MSQLLHACFILLPFGICLRMSLRLLYGARGPQEGDPIHQVVHAASWLLTILPLIVLIVVGTNWLSGFLFLTTCMSGLELMLARREMQRNSAWSLIAKSSHAQQSVSESLLNHQGRFTGIVGRAFRKLTQAVQLGTPLPEAISKNWRALPIMAQAYASIDAVSEADLQGHQGVEHFNSDPPGTAGQQLYQRFAYLMVLFLIMLSIFTFVMIKIVPSYQAIFDDFGLELPAITTSLIATSELLLSSHLGGLFIMGLSLLALVSVVVAMLYLCDISILRPVTDRLFFTKHRAIILELLAISAERGLPFAAAIQQLTEGEQRYPSHHVRRKLKLVLRLISSGQNWKAALHKASFLKRSDLPILETSQQAGNLVWVLRMLSGQKVRMMVFRWTAFEKIFFPVIILAVSLLVLWFCVALFLPLVDLINNLT